MEFFKFSFTINKKNKKLRVKKFLQIFYILLNIILSFNSISTEIKIISNPYSTISNLKNSKNSKLRNLAEQYIYGSAFKLNYYYTNIYLGDDMQKQGLILDTGSSITTATCSPLCQKCGNHISPPYDIKKEKKIISCSEEKCKMVSSKCDNSTKSNCTFKISYSEGSSLEGVYVNEIIRFGENYTQQEGKYIPMGCTSSETHLFYKQEVNGIMGLCNNEKNFVDILYKFGAIKRNMFSLCYAKLGGIFTLGEINYKLHTENITFLPMKTDRDKYFGLDVKSIFVNDKKVENYNYGIYNVFIDSGTTISYFNNLICDGIVKIMMDECAKFKKKDACGKYEYLSDFGFCYTFNNTNDLDYAVKNYWPTIHFNLNGYDYKWTPERYSFNITNKNKIGACMGFAKTSGNKITLGSTWLIGHDIIFDREKKLLGFAEANCFQNKNLNMTNGLEFIEYFLSKRNIKNIISLVIIILANFLLISLIILIILIILKKNNQNNLKREIMELKIREHNSESNIEINKSNNDASYINVMDDSSRGNKNQISLN